MSNVTTLGGTPYPESTPRYRGEEFEVHGDGRLVFTRAGVEQWGPLMRAIGVDIRQITTVEAFSEAAVRTQSKLARYAAEQAAPDEGADDWLIYNLLLGGDVVAQAKELNIESERESLLHPVEEKNSQEGGCRGDDPG